MYTRTSILAFTSTLVVITACGPDSDMGGYHTDEVTRQSLTKAAPEADDLGPGYTEDSWGDCEVHAECGAYEVCASDPACPEFTYCYALPDPIADGCDCGDRYHTVCFEGECVLRGTDCGLGCPEEIGYACSPSGFCVCVEEQCAGWEPPADAPRPAWDEPEYY